MSIKYNLGKIYTLRTYNDESLIYVGSTTQSLSKRYYEHKRCYKSYCNISRNYMTSFKIIECGNTYIELLESVKCNSKEELHTREGEWIRKIDCVNKIVAGRTPKQWRDDNKDKVKVCRNRYRENNKDKIQYTKKRYRENNKDKLNEYQKQYREKNKDKIKANKSKNCICVCGRQYILNDKKRHMRSKIHHELFIKKMEQRIHEMTEIIKDSIK